MNVKTRPITQTPKTQRVQAQQLPSGTFLRACASFDFDTEAAATAAPRVSPHLLEVLRVKEVAQAVVILKRHASVAAAVEPFEAQAAEIEQYLVMDDRGWAASIANAAGDSSMSAALSARPRGKAKSKKPASRPKALRFSSLGVVLGDVHSQGLAALQ